MSDQEMSESVKSPLALYSKQIGIFPTPAPMGAKIGYHELVEGYF